jgi:hypothetical protein
MIQTPSNYGRSRSKKARERELINNKKPSFTGMALASKLGLEPNAAGNRDVK